LKSLVSIHLTATWPPAIYEAGHLEAYTSVLDKLGKEVACAK
jgi:hypothetical protein